MEPFKQTISFLSPNTPLHAIRLIRQSMGFPLHYHSAFELHLIEKGEGVYSINGELYKFRPCQLVTIRPNQVHSFISYSQKVPIEKYTVQFLAKAVKSASLADIDKYFPTIVQLSKLQYSSHGGNH